jgi:hypothetical protein
MASGYHFVIMLLVLHRLMASGYHFIIMLPVLHRLMASGYHFGIFRLFSHDMLLFYYVVCVSFLIDLKTRAVAPFSPDARTCHNIYKLQKHVLLRHQSYLLVFMGNTNLRFWEIMPL